MIVLARTGFEGRQLTCLFGAGLIGRSVVNAMLKSDWSELRVLPFTWHSPARQADELEAIAQLIAGDDAGRVDLIWSAGKIGFSSTSEEAHDEFQDFDGVLKWFAGLKTKVRASQLTFHLVSSAGGLFEGESMVDLKSAPAPSRPYGRSKLNQEERLLEHRRDIACAIYRPSSVYGFAGTGIRVGLVNALLTDSLKNRVSVIFGALSTIRDYVLAADVGKFIARKTEVDFDEPMIWTLASCRPTAMFQMLRVTEKIVKRPLLLRFDAQPSNTKPITFARSTMPDGWAPTDLETGIRLTAMSLAFLASSLGAAHAIPG